MFGSFANDIVPGIDVSVIAVLSSRSTTAEYARIEVDDI